MFSFEVSRKHKIVDVGIHVTDARHKNGADYIINGIVQRWKTNTVIIYGNRRGISVFSLHRLHRAQLRLAGFPVEGWPFAPDYCRCAWPMPTIWGNFNEATCTACGKEIEK